MKNTNQCLILAAGNGTRLRSVSSGLPKPLVQLRGKPILEHVIEAAHQAGVDNFVIVVGYRSDLIRSSLNDRLAGEISVTWVENPDYHKSNGISALAAQNKIHGNFLLLMADHIFEADTAKALIHQRLGHDEVILAVDPHIDRIFDLDDATKVRRDSEHIVEIGKEISRYDSLDTGMFLCTPALFDRLESATVNGDCSLSDGMRLLARDRKLRAFEIDSDWQDLDTPEALAHAEGTFDWYLQREPNVERLAGV